MVQIQQPTCTNVRIRSTTDAHKIFYAIQRGRLRMITRRLDADERLALRSGCVYAWEERGPHSEVTGLGIERFTEGRRWSPSRVRDEFLFYYEKYSPDVAQSSNSEKQQPPRHWDQLVKQTYSVWVDTDKGKRKWHLTAYFTQATVDGLGTVDDIDGVGNVDVPENIYKSTRMKKSTLKSEETTSTTQEPTNVTPILPAPTKSSNAVFPLSAAQKSPLVPEKPPMTTQSSSSQPASMYTPFTGQYNSGSHDTFARPQSSVHYTEISPIDSKVSSNYHEPPAPTPEHIPLRLTIPPSPTGRHPRAVSHSQSYTPVETLSMASPMYHSPIEVPSEAPNTTWNMTYPQKEIYENVQQQQHSYTQQPLENAPRAGMTPNANSPQPFIHLKYHSPSPVRPLPPRAFSSPSFPNTEQNPTPVPSTSMYAPHPQIQRQPGHPSFGDVRFPADFHPIRSHLPGHSTPAYAETSTSPVSSGSGGGSIYGDNIVNYEGPPVPSYEHSAPNRGLAPLGVLKRSHPYRRHPGDDKALRMLARRNANPESELETQ